MKMTKRQKTNVQGVMKERKRKMRKKGKRRKRKGEEGHQHLCERTEGVRRAGGRGRDSQTLTQNEAWRQRMQDHYRHKENNKQKKRKEIKKWKLKPCDSKSAIILLLLLLLIIIIIP